MSKKRSKFVPIANKNDFNSFLMPGRHKCDCAATKHELINNCTGCGRIICGQEGSGPCWYCGELVCTNEEFQQILNRSSSKNMNLLNRLNNCKWSHQNAKENIDLSTAINGEKYSNNELAEQRKQRLLEFDRTSARRTKVIDDEKDYYETEGKLWIDSETKKTLKSKENELREKRFAPKHSRPLKYTLDLVKGELVEEHHTNEAAYELFEEPEIAEPNKKTDYVVQPESNLNTDFLTFIVPKGKLIEHTKQSESDHTKSVNRVQDKVLREIRDDGMCLSMHQPWALLLVLGVKIHEGRSWFTNHRGRLWIGATGKAPQPETINEVQKFYIDRGIDKSRFPQSYPVGCILGCVDVVDCLPEDEYTEMYPNGESGSPYIFICENPRELRLKFPIKGKHKIYKLESHVHLAAKCGIERGE